MTHPMRAPAGVASLVSGRVTVRRTWLYCLGWLEYNFGPLPTEHEFLVECCKKYADGMMEAGRLVELAGPVVAELHTKEACYGEDWRWANVLKAALDPPAISEVVSVLFYAEQYEGDWFLPGGYGGGDHRHVPPCVLGCDLDEAPRPHVSVDPRWLRANGAAALHLGRAIYEEERFSEMPLLADALEDGGCGDARVLDHCRAVGRHFRGCFVVDALLGKT